METFVQASDGLFYKNPVIAGCGWFLHFDSDEGAELVVKRAPRSTLRSNWRRASAGLRKLGVKFRILGSAAGLSKMAFPPTWVGLHDADVYSIEVLSQVPVPSCGGGVGQPPVGCRIIATVLEFSREAVLSVIWDKSPDRSLLEHLGMELEEARRWLARIPVDEVVRIDRSKIKRRRRT